MSNPILNKNFVEIQQTNNQRLYIAIDDISYFAVLGINTENLLYLKSKTEAIKTKLDLDGFNRLLKDY